MSDEKYNILLAIEDGLIHPFVSYARDNGDSEEDITEAAKIGIGKNIKNYTGLVSNSILTVKNYLEIDTTPKRAIQVINNISEYKHWQAEAERALKILNEGYEIKYKSETINPL